VSKLGLVLYHGFQSGAEIAKYASIADRYGFDSLWMTERSGHEEAFATLGYAAASSETLRLGLGVANSYSRHPVLLAMAAATLDRLSGGRFILGMGTSDRDVIEDKLGIPHQRPLVELERTIASLRGLFTGETVSTENGHSSILGVKLGVKPVTSPLPIYMAASGPRALRLAGRVADGVILNTYSPVSYVRWAVSTARQAATDAGRDPGVLKIVCMLVIRLVQDRKPLYPGFKERLARLLAEPQGGEVLLQESSFDPELVGRICHVARTQSVKLAAELVPNEMVDEFYVFGDLERCKQHIAEYQKAGVEQPLLLPRLQDFETVALALKA